MSRITEQKLVEMFNEFLDEGEEVTVLGFTFLPSEVLKNTDPIAYRTEMANYADSLSKNGLEVEGYE